MRLNDAVSELARFRAEIPTKLYFGRGTFNDAAEICRGLGRRVLLVTGRSAMQRLGYVQQLGVDLKEAGIESERFAEVRPSPTTDDVDRGAKLCRNFQADFLIALGGGSVDRLRQGDCRGLPWPDACSRLPLPSGIPARGHAPCRGDSHDLRHGKRTQPLGDHHRSAKYRSRTASAATIVFPRLAIVDATLTGSLDRVQTAQTGFDCFSHAVESYVSPKAATGHGPAGA